MKMRKLRLGDKVKDTFTDLKGTIVAKTVYIHGCTQYEVQPRELHDGMVVEGAWIDEPQLALIEKPKPRPVPKKRLYGGHNRSHP